MLITVKLWKIHVKAPINEMLENFYPKFTSKKLAEMTCVIST